MRNNHDNPKYEPETEMAHHDEFLELCALSTSGDLDEHEQRKLWTHIATCPPCRKALKEFEAIVNYEIPKLAFESTEVGLETNASTTDQVAEKAFVERPSREAVSKELQFSPLTHRIVMSREGQLKEGLNWNYVWMPFAATIVLVATLGIYAYRIGSQRGVGSAGSTGSRPSLRQDVASPRDERAFAKSQMEEREKIIASLKQQIAKQSADMIKLRTIQRIAESSARDNEQVKEQIVAERNALSEQLQSASASLAKAQASLDSLQSQRSQDSSRAASLEARLDELSHLLEGREKTIEQEEQLLAYDRDIRELMGARDLYIAEVYDVARDGMTQKPYGRVFYAKGKLLTFYAYDLNQGAGFKNASTFQAWGRRGPERNQALNLGIFYEDSESKKRWVLKFDDPKMLEQIDAVFVTLEPNGGSNRPSGKPLLFAYLKTQANHP
jgi:hypothetical protein